MKSNVCHDGKSLEEEEEKDERKDRHPCMGI